MSGVLRAKATTNAKALEHEDETLCINFSCQCSHTLCIRAYARFAYTFVCK